ncbi:hypothetical protein [Roseococcus sp.]|uniref:hypothetical protein n=1 Tax=Roseococcus sp. TaxID=2109646 RepID=UPI003BA9A9D9
MPARTGLAVLLALAAWLAPAQAQAQDGPAVVSIRDGARRPLDSRPSERAVVTFRDILRELYPDLGPDGRASRTLGARAVPDAVAGEDTPPGPAEIDLADGEPASWAMISEGERDHVAILVAGALVMAQVAPEYRPAGALLVQTDRGGPPSIAQMVLLGEGRAAVAVMNGHQDGAESFAQYLIATPVEDRLQQVFQGPTLYSVQRDARGCEPWRLEERMTSLTTREPSREGYAELVMAVREARICTQRGRPRTLNALIHYGRLRWDPAQARYLGGLDALDRRNQRLMGGG